jgi:hypothetical protein
LRVERWKPFQPKPKRQHEKVKGKVMAMSAIGAIRCMGGLVMCADTEEVIPEALRTRGEKLHVMPAVRFGDDSWVIVLSGAGDVDWTHMAKDFIEERVATGTGTDAEIIHAIRTSISEIWSDYARYSQDRVSLRLLIGSYSTDKRSRFTVVTDQAVRQGRDVEAMGIGDATFRGLADRFLSRYVALEVAQIFSIYAIQQIKETIPGVGGNTRVITLNNDGSTKWEKSFKVMAVQEFFSKLNSEIRHTIDPAVLDFTVGPQAAPTEDTLRTLYGRFTETLLSDIEELRREIVRIENDPTLA